MPHERYVLKKTQQNNKTPTPPPKTPAKPEFYFFL